MGSLSYAVSVVGCGVGLYLWLLSSGRTHIRLRSCQEARQVFPGRAVAAVAAALMLGGVLAIAGERAIRSVASGISPSGVGSDNAFSRGVALLAPALLSVGVLNLLAAASKRMFVMLVAGAANSVLSILVYYYGSFIGLPSSNNGYSSYRAKRSDEGYGYGYSSGGYGYSSSSSSSSSYADWGASRLFTDSSTFSHDWVMAAKNQMYSASFPPEPLSTYHLLRTLPTYLCMFLPLMASVIYLRCMFRISVIEDQEGPQTRNRSSAFPSLISCCIFVLGLVSVLVSVILGSAVCKLSIVTSVDHDAFTGNSATLVGLLTATGLVAAIQSFVGSAKLKRALMLLLMVLGVLTFVWAYGSLDMTDGIEAKAAVRRAKLSSGPTKCDSRKEEEEEDKHGLSTVVKVYIGQAEEGDSSSAMSNPSYGPPSAQISVQQQETTDSSSSDKNDTLKADRVFDPSLSCFSVVSDSGCSADSATVACIPKEKVCDGVADLATPAYFCHGYGDSSYCGNSYVVSFADESDCSVSVSPALSSCRGSCWTAMVAALLIVALAAFGGGKDGGDRDGMPAWQQTVADKLRRFNGDKDKDVEC